MSEFMYIFAGGSPMGSPEEMQQQMQRWLTWSKDLREKGHLKSGHPLESKGKTVTGKQKTITDGPFAESKDLVGGYMIVEANDLDHAVELSLGCPGLSNDGVVEVRPVMAM